MVKILVRLPNREMHLKDYLRAKQNFDAITA